MNPPRGVSVLKALLLSLPVFAWGGWNAFLWYPPFAAVSPSSAFGSLCVTSLFLGLIFYLMLRKGETDRFRFLLVVVLSACCLLIFHHSLLKRLGTGTVRPEHLFSGGATPCPVSIPSFLASFAWDRTILFPAGEQFSTLTMIVVVFGLALFTVGRGWCSWFCPFAGVDSLFSSLLNRPVIRKVNPRWGLLPFAVLSVVLILSPITYLPWYCRWVCPLKPITDLEAITDGGSVARLAISSIILVFGVGLLSVLTKKRTMCAYLCPLGAVYSIFSKVTPFSVRVRQDQCKGCQRCIAICPTSSLTPKSLEAGRADSNCTLCGKCVDACGWQALVYHIAGTQIGSHQELKRYLWLLIFYSFGMSGFYMHIAAAVFSVTRIIHGGN